MGVIGNIGKVNGGGSKGSEGGPRGSGRFTGKGWPKGVMWTGVSIRLGVNDQG